jgi:RNA polymerase sigma-70 factor, ECF subfamily
MVWTEEDLIKIKRRDPGIFARIYEENRKQIYNFLLLKTNGNKDLCDDILSETFYYAIKNAPKLNDANKISSWLWQIANRRYYDILRKKYRDIKYFKINDKEHDPDRIAANSETDAKDDEITEEQVLLTKIAMDIIKPQFKEVINLKYNDHMSQKEIAEKMDKSVSAVENLLFKARNALKKELKKLMRN